VTPDETPEREPSSGELEPAIADSSVLLPPDSMSSIVNECVERMETLGQRRVAPAAWLRRVALRQHERRREEQLTRGRVAAVGQRIVTDGWLWRDVSHWLHVPPRTLRAWRRPHEESIRLLGRPPLRSPRERRNEVIHLLDEVGPHLGIPALREHFPDLARAELTDLLRRYRVVWRERHRQPLRTLHWTTPGRVWAIDFAETPLPIEGNISYLLAVRDLASGMQLLWQPLTAATAEAAAEGLARLFVAHGPPLVLKCDNGSPFISGVVADLLAGHGVAPLFSPPMTPRYNGAIEAGIGSLKERTHAAAARAGHPDNWTWDDLATAQYEANFSSRPCGPDGPCPELIWQARTPIEEPERSLFQSRMQEMLIEAKCREAACESVTSEVWSERAMARLAIRRTLERCGYLTYRRRRIPPSIYRSKVANIM
jgi:transposase InsO family protein